VSQETYDYAIVLDFEATCERGARITPQEIIEYPSVLVDLSSLEVVDTFESFVRPHHHPELTEFCTELTSIVQSDVDDAPPFREVLEAHHAWLDGHGLSADNALFVTCGDWDLNSMFPAQLEAADPPIPHMRPIYAEWLNIKELYMRALNRRRAPGMMRMMRLLGLEHRGRHHRGIDDTHNIARILIHLLELGATFGPTRRLKRKRHDALVREKGGTRWA
jgi:inhibitor of KinA sporulation pathway (predicted exonuclease)